MKKYFAKLSIVLFAFALLSGCAQQGNFNSHRVESNELGTKWGESTRSYSKGVNATRVSASTPDDTLVIHYDANRIDNLQSMPYIPFVGDRLEFAIVDEDLRPMNIYTNNGYNYRLMGREGERYQLLIRNRSDFPYEIVATIDGLDVLNGQPGSFSNNGYIVEGRNTLVIEGFRQSNQSVALFRFSKPDAAYANNTPAGDASNVGVIGIAAFALMADPSISQIPAQSGSKPNAFPAQNNQGQFAPAPIKR
ncbi:hypothetical protein [Thorsellia anophelis]|uniref:Outer membrane lipoprotein n=1 Tax=Thorsellia anophelis DSM 18579 TaxID=1123402 RepID=A0A1I0D0W3_9GAMM|nr:hypothetical protein [Thorsellia anophelis]SET25540.1 hypothetical protein SAMN02583745_01802 [Thorsellia anophelis DSM 18579]